MKKFLFISIFFLCSVYVNAQTWKYHPMPDSNAVWIYGVYGNCPPLNLCGYIYYTVHGDTVIGSHTYKKIYGSSDGLTYGFNRGIRQDTIAKKVYAYNLCGIDTLLYDFSQHVGDTLHLCISITGGGGPFPINSVDSVLISGKWRKRINPNLNASLIEGIGSTGGLLGPWNGWEGGNYALKCFSINGIPVYPDTICDINTGININTKVSKINFQVYPNPVSRVSDIRINMQSASIGKISLYNFTGGESKIIFSGKLNSGINAITFDASNLSSGLYLLQLIDEKGNYITNKVVEIIH